MRKPIIALHGAAKAAKQAELGADADNMPLGLSDAEKKAAIPVTAEEIKAMSEPVAVAAPAAPSFVPPTLKKVAVVVASVGALALLALPVVPFALPAWLGLVVFAVTSISGFLAGLAMPGFGGGAPIVPLTAVPGCLALAAFLTEHSTHLPPMLQSIARLIAALLMAAAGKAIPPPTQPAKA